MRRFQVALDKHRFLKGVAKNIYAQPTGRDNRAVKARGGQQGWREVGKELGKWETSATASTIVKKEKYRFTW